MLNKHVRTLLKSHHERIVYELFRGLRGAAPAGRAQRIAMELFGAVCHRIKPHRGRKFMQSLLQILEQILQTGDVLLLETLGAQFDPIAAHLLPFLTEPEARHLVALLVAVLALPQAAIRRAIATALVSVARHYPQRTAILTHILASLRALCPPGAALPEPLHEGLLHAFTQLYRAAPVFHHAHRYSSDPLAHDVAFAARFALASLDSPASNIVVGALELLLELFVSHADTLLASWTAPAPAFMAPELRDLLTRCSTFLGAPQDSVRISIKALVLDCFAQLLATHSTLVPVATLLREGLVNGPTLQSVFALVSHPDPTLRGHAASFAAAFFSNALLEGVSVPSDEIGSTIDSLVTMMHSDVSSISAKFAASALAALALSLAQTTECGLALRIVEVR